MEILLVVLELIGDFHEEQVGSSTIRIQPSILNIIQRTLIRITVIAKDGQSPKVTPNQMVKDFSNPSTNYVTLHLLMVTLVQIPTRISTFR